ncbi:thioredoxin [Brevibacillus agri]|uniref:Thioredoxin n=1 Tax=Brevibacillus agri TaxID=51101 RepID=A0A3M8ABA3_9BACL|nr:MULTISPECIES: thioredoxin family protein [Brevibacillus]ELK40771.1 protein disulfide oxidoreductase [Brevibacillus agri BAB-2500]EJL41624.1 thioredoxin domain-containing protein [Brevibacillus sp. CF112]MBG9565457.1 thioredoxin [Brevibacillus agri]MBY0054693.1 thioredoxin family protein [Brevibacillus agri]MCG5251182.1 thioredoxin family protein [Brevibacillus agri]
MKKIIFFSILVAALLIGAIVYSDISNREAAAGNPYGKANLNPATIEQLKDPLYDNLIMPEELKQKIESKEDLFVYYYSPLCEHCRATTPVLVPIVKDMQIDMKKHNLLEFNASWDEFQIEFTPTLVHYKDGKEVARLVGGHEADEWKKWLEEQKKS